MIATAARRYQELGINTTTGAIYQRLDLNSPPEEGSFSLRVLLEISPDLAKRVQALNDTKHIQLPLCMVAGREKSHALTILSVPNIRSALFTLDSIKNPTDEEQVTIEEYRAALMRSVQLSLRKKAPPAPTALTVHEASEVSIWAKLWSICLRSWRAAKRGSKWGLFGVLFVLEFGPDFYSGFLYAAMTLAALVPYVNLVSPVSSSVMTWLGIACVANSMIGTICFIVPILLDRMGLSWVRKKQAFPRSLKLQLEATKKINRDLIMENSLSSEDYKAYSTCAKLFNKRIDCLKKDFPKLKEPWYSKIANIIMVTLMTLKSASGSLFMVANAIAHQTGVGLFDPVAITNFIAANLWAVALWSIPVFFPHLIIGFYLRFSSTTKVINPAAEEHKEVKKHVEKYKIKEAEQLDEIHAKKQRVEFLQRAYDERHQRVTIAGSSIVNLPTYASPSAKRDLDDEDRINRLLCINGM